MCAAVPRLISSVPSELAPIVNRRHDGSEQCQPARLAIWSFVLTANSSRFFFAIERDYVDFHTPTAATETTVTYIRGATAHACSRWRHTSSTIQVSASV